MKYLALALLLLIFVGGVGAKVIDPSKRVEAASSTSLVAFNGLDPDTVARAGGYVDITLGMWTLGFMPSANQTLTLTGLNTTLLTYTVDAMGIHFIHCHANPIAASTPYAYNSTSNTITVIATGPNVWISWAPLVSPPSGYWVIFVAVAAIIFLQLKGKR